MWLRKSVGFQVSMWGPRGGPHTIINNIFSKCDVANLLSFFPDSQVVRYWVDTILTILDRRGSCLTDGPWIWIWRCLHVLNYPHFSHHTVITSNLPSNVAGLSELNTHLWCISVSIPKTPPRLGSILNLLAILIDSPVVVVLQISQRSIGDYPLSLTHPLVPLPLY